MRFALAHKMSTYIMVTCAYAALAMGGFLGEVWVMLALLGIVASWFWEPPRVRLERWALPWTIAALVVFGISTLEVLGGRDVLLVGAEFLMFLTVVKLFNRRACKDYQHVYVLAFLMLVAGTVLNYEVTYGIFFLGFVVSSTWSLILFHLRREMEDNFLLKHSDGRPSERVEVARILGSRRIVGGRFFAGSAAVSLGIFMFASLLFFLIPRIGFGFFFQKDRGALQMAGFSDGIQLGAHGVIKDNRTVVMRVKVDRQYQGRGAPYLHWRGVAFDRYHDGTWLRTMNAPLSRRQVTYGDGVARYHMLYVDHPGTVQAAELERRRKHGMRQEIYLEPMGNDVLFGASMPLAFELGRLAGNKRPRRSRNDELRLLHTQGIKYTVYSDVNQPPAAELRKAPANFLPDGFQVYLQGVDELTPETVQLAADITRGLDNNYDKAVAIESWLRSNLGYTLHMKDPHGVEPIHFFLFQRKKGHCEYFSSAMTMMVRSLGIPARNVNGFLGGEWNEYDDYIAVRAGDAHSWVEIYFPGHGWVTFDPTPAGERDFMGRGGTGWREKMRRFFDNMRFKWFKWIIEYDIYQQLSIFRGIGDKLRGGGRSARTMISAVGNWLREHRLAAGGAGGGLLLLVVGLALWRRRRRRTGSGGSAPRRRRRSQVGAIHARAEEELARHNHGRPPARTPREHARVLAGAGLPGAGPYAALTDLYYEVEYGGLGGDDDDDRAQVLARQIRNEWAEARRSGRAA